MNENTGAAPDFSTSDEQSLVVEVIWHDNLWRGACINPLDNEACVHQRYGIWQDKEWDIQRVNEAKRIDCSDPSVPGHCTDSRLFSIWKWRRWLGHAPAQSRKPPHILFVVRSPEPDQDGVFYFSGLYTPQAITGDPENPDFHTVHGVPEKSSWFSPLVQIPLQDFLEPTNRMASKGRYISTALARRILEAELREHRNLSTRQAVDADQRHEADLIAYKIENALGSRSSSDGLGDLAALLKLKGQIILSGPPGVGKTYQARRLVSQMLGLDPDAIDTRDRRQLGRILRQRPALADDPAQLAQAVLASPSPHGIWDIVQFHPSYAYEDFVRGIRAEPEGKGNSISFRPVNRILGLLIDVAGHLGSDVPVLLIVDEINRGDMAKVLGELIYALEYRDETVVTPYAVGGKPGLRVPSNFYLIGTMNTADRAIALVDYAIRRRFSFVHLAPDRNVIAQYYSDPVLRQGALDFFDKTQSLFETLGTGYAVEDLAVGHSYFLARDSEELAAKIAFEVAPLLVEYYKEGILVTSPELRLDSRLDLIESDSFTVEQQVREWLERNERSSA